MAENVENLDATRVSQLRCRAKRRVFRHNVAGLPSLLKRTFCQTTDICLTVLKHKFSILINLRRVRPLPLPFPIKPSVVPSKNQTIKLSNITEDRMHGELHYIEVPWIKGPDECAWLTQYQAIQRQKNGQSDGK